MYQGILSNSHQEHPDTYYSYIRKVILLFESQKILFSLSQMKSHYLVLSEHNLSKGDFPEYYLNHQKYLQVLADESDCPPLRQTFQMSQLLYQNGQVLLAQQSFLKLLDQLFSSNQSENLDMAGILVYLGEIEYLQDNLAESLMLYRKVLQIYEYVSLCLC